MSDFTTKLDALLADRSDGIMRSKQEAFDQIASGALVDEFITFVATHGHNEAGGRARMEGYYVEEVLRLVGDLRIQTVFTSGVSQLIKSFANAQFQAFLTQIVGFRSGWAFPTELSKTTNVPKQHLAILKSYAKIGGSKRLITANTLAFASDQGGLISWAHLNTGGSASGGAEAGSGIVSFTADVLFSEEHSQSSEKAVKPLYRRGDASEIGRHFDMAAPFRGLGTPGGGGGIERDIRNCHFEFHPHSVCPHCREVINLSPLGCLLRPVTNKEDDGSVSTTFFDKAGMPARWFHHDADSPKDSAYFGCPKCGQELPDEVRFNARFKCVKTGMWLVTFLKQYVPENWQTNAIRVGIWCGPLLRHKKGRRLAAEILNEVESPEGMLDWIQQRLGVPSSEISNTITPTAITKAIERPLWVPKVEYQGQNRRPVQTHEVVRLLGLDQGTASHYLTIVEFLYPKGLPPSTAEQQAKRNVLFMEGIHVSDLPGLMRQYKVQGGMLDVNPMPSSAMNLCRELQLVPGVQKPKQLPEFAAAKAREGGEEYDVIGLRYYKWCKQIMTLFARNMYSIDERYAHQQYDQSNALSIYRHLTGVSWDNEEGKIQRDRAKIDDYFFALMFCEAAFSLFLAEPYRFASLDNTDWWRAW